MKSITDKNIRDDLEFSKNLINNLVAKKPNPVEEAGPKLSDEDKQSMADLSEAVGEITGMRDLVIKRKKIEHTSPRSKSITEQCLNLLDQGNFNDKMVERMLSVIDHHERTEKIILQFLGKYR